MALGVTQPLTEMSTRKVVSSGMLRRVAFVRTDVSKESSASIRVTRIGQLGTTLAVIPLGISSQRASVASYS
jgi:hypothetical protein